MIGGAYQYAYTLFNSRCEQAETVEQQRERTEAYNHTQSVLLGAQKTTFDRPEDNHESLQGEGHNGPHAERVKHVAEVDDCLTPAVSVEQVNVLPELEPHHGDAQEKPWVHGGHETQVERAGLMSESCWAGVHCHHSGVTQ